MKQYINPDKSKTYRQKAAPVKKLINETLYILENFGIPINGTSRRIERMAIAFLACGDIKSIDDFKRCKDLDIGYSLKTRDIIKYVNLNFSEEISSGSYDDIRRKDLKLLTVAGIVLPSNPELATNDSTRGYTVNPIYADLVRRYGNPNWTELVIVKLKGVVPLDKKLRRERDLNMVSVDLPKGVNLSLSLGKHNNLQKAIVEEFLPRYGYGARVLYIGDTSAKYLYIKKEKLKELRFFELSHEELPDIIAYSEEKNWLYLIEAVHSSNPISEIRLIELQRLTENCIAEIVFVTTFLDRKTFRKFTADIAWETEVWIADNPDHLIHFNGDKFLGPYKNNTT